MTNIKETLKKAVVYFLVMVAILAAVILGYDIWRFWFHHSDANLRITVNLVSSAEQTTPDFRGYTFTSELQEAIENGEISLLGIEAETIMNNGSHCELIATTKDAEDDVSRIYVKSAEFNKRSEDERKYYSAEAWEEVKDDGWWNYTIDIIK